MKVGIIGDVHFCEYSSILRQNGEIFSKRLENCVQSINWAEQITEKENCDFVVYLGDFFDRSDLNANELTALSNVILNDKLHYFLVGNHEMAVNDLHASSAHMLLMGNRTKLGVIDSPIRFNVDNFEFCFLPYVLEENRKNYIEEYFGPARLGTRRVIFSHNDIAGIQMGQFISKSGFDIEDIEMNCDMMFNGHIHNGSWVTNKIVNVGNLTGQNFSEDAFKYGHNIVILDTEELDTKINIIPNPFAINFYKIENLSDLYKVNNAVVTVKTTQELSEQAKELLESDNIVASRLVIDYSKTEKKDIKSLSVDHLDEFRKFAFSELNESVDSELLEKELDYIYA